MYSVEVLCGNALEWITIRVGGKVPCIVQWNAITAQEWLAINRGEEEASN